MTDGPVIIELGIVREYVGTVLAVVISSALTAMGLIRKRKKDQLANKKDDDGIESIDEKRERIKTLEKDIAVLAAERNSAVSALGGFQTEVRLQNELLASMRTERLLEARELRDALSRAERRADEMQRVLLSKLEENTELTKTGIQVATDAFVEANNVNTKIREVGLQVADGTLLSTRNRTPGDVER